MPRNSASNTKPAVRAGTVVKGRRPSVTVPRLRRKTTLRSTPVTMMSSAPVSVGNTVRGVASKTVMLPDGCVVTGRDFMFSPVGSGAIQTWTLVGGAPLTPAAFADSTLRQYMQMYQRFRFKRIIAHYITSSPTSANGDVMFYYGKNRDSVFLNQTSGNLLPFVISDPNTVLGPQWQNHSAAFNCTGDWRSCDYGMESNPSLYADGELFLMSKTSTVDSPGYVMFDYTIEFSQKSISPRLLSLPITRILWSQLGLSFNNAAAVTNTPVIASVGGNNISGLASALPTGTISGDVFKVIFDVTNSTFAGAGSGAFIVSNIANQPTQFTSSITLQDGTTLYAVYSGNGVWSFYTNSAAAYSNDRPLLYSATNAITGTTIQVWVSYIGAITGINNAPNF